MMQQNGRAVEVAQREETRHGARCADIPRAAPALPRYSVLVATNHAQEPDRRAFFLEPGSSVLATGDW